MTEDIRIGGRDPLAAQRGGILVLDAIGHRDRQSAPPVVQCHDLLEQRSDAARLKREPLFLDDIHANDAQIADVLLDEIRNVIVAHEQHVQRHVLAVAHELILATAVLQSAAHQQVERVVRQSPGFLQCDLQTCGFVDHFVLAI